VGKHILILGGGFGGLSAAETLRKGLTADHRVTIVDHQPLFFMGLTKLWILSGERQVGEKPGNRNLLTKRGIDFIEGEVNAIDVTGNQVTVGKQRLTYDYLIIALGADYSYSTPEGFTKYAKNLYTESGCAEIRDVLRSTKAGTITVLVCGLPFKCPPAPYEASMIIDNVLRKNGSRSKVTLQIVTPEPHPLGILGPEAGRRVTKLLADRGIEYHPSQKVKEIRQGCVITEEGKEIPHDLVLAIPKHIAPSVLRESGLLDETGWIPVDSGTLATMTANVFAIGDCAGTKIPKGPLLPRAGTLAEGQGRVVAQNIIRHIRGVETSALFDGEGVCYMETGGGMAVPVRANFFAQPNPTWEFSTPSEEGYRQKRDFLEERIRTWFG
jgi:sulfide:quinone oxidoreductase